MVLVSSTPTSPSAKQHMSVDPLAATSSPITAGTAAPAFELATAPDRKVVLSDFRGQPVVLVFYPADWSPVCTDQLALYNELLPVFENWPVTCRPSHYRRRRLDPRVNLGCRETTQAHARCPSTPRRTRAAVYQPVLPPRNDEALSGDPTRPKRAYPGRGQRACQDESCSQKPPGVLCGASQGVFRLT